MRWFVFILLPALFWQPAVAQTLDEVAVYIECTASNGAVTKGTGVLVSPDGYILTAAHVVPQDSSGSEKCIGILGSTNGPQSTLRIADRKHSSFDAAVLKYTPSAGSQAKFLHYCEDIKDLRGVEVLAAGFPGNTTSGTLSVRKGVVSTVTEDENAAIETDVLVAPGMSGGLVTLAERNVLLGIAVGAAFVDPGLGADDPRLARVRVASSYEIIPVRRLVGEFGAFGLQPDKGCMTKAKLTEVTDHKWSAGRLDNIPLGIFQAEGFCFLSGVYGTFNDPGDRVWIGISDDGMYELRGEQNGGGTHGATAQCFRY